MRIRAGIVLLEKDAVALIERYRNGLHYFVFPGGGVNEGESPEQAAEREMHEETGLQVVIRQRLAVVHFGQVSLQYYFLAERLVGQFGQGAGEEMSNLHPDDPGAGIYLPVWMSIEVLRQRDDVYPRPVANLVATSVLQGWPNYPLEFFEEVTPVWPPSGS